MNGGIGLLALLCCCACGSAVLEGADAVPATELPSGQLLSVLEPRDCLDATGKAVSRPATRITVMRSSIVIEVPIETK